MEDTPDLRFSNNTYNFFYSKEALSQQIVPRSSHWGEPSSSALREDVQNFDRDIDATFEDSPPQTIDPALLLPMAPQHFPTYYPPTSPSTDTATVSSATSWRCSEASSPPTSPEYIPGEDSYAESHKMELSVDPSQNLSQEQLEQLVREFFGDSPVGRNAFNNGTLAFSSPQPATAPAYSTPFVDTRHEQPLQQYPGAAVADVHGLGTGTQVNAFDSGLTGAWSVGGPSSLPIEHTPSTDPVKHAPYNQTKAAHVRRKASTKKDPKEKPIKKLPCPRPGCSKAFARSFNLHEHIAKVHDKERPWKCSEEGCPKATAPYCRKYDLDLHVAKKHPASPLSQAHVGGTTPAFDGPGTPPV